ncbi:cilia- and flagella-associated protein 53 [Procambarus clarkii]|uniref:cilia- and flagella-associated protein 53 n=1 Tax=Procambarus clarkii TaxID=6728 RepID=UPI00374201A2
MTEAQTDWLACGARRCKAQRVAETLAARTAQYSALLCLRRSRLKALLDDDEARDQEELRRRARLLLQEQHAVRVEAAAAAAARQEEERLRHVQQADEQRCKQQCHQYREAYSRTLQRQLNEARADEITLKEYMRHQYGIPPPPGKRP